MLLPSSSRYGPQDEPGRDILLEKMLLNGNSLSVFFYALQMVLFFACIRILLKRRPRTTTTALLSVYCIFVTISSTVFIILAVYSTQLQFIDFRNYPGGPLGFIAVELASPSYQTFLASYLCGNIAADILLLWRCRSIWKPWLKRAVDFIIVLPGALVIIFSLVAGALWIHTEATSSVDETSITAFWPTAHLCSSLALNICLTLLIVGRMYAHLRKTQAILGRRHIRPYQAISRIFLESAALYSTTAVGLLITYLLHTPVYQLFMAVNPSVQIIASFLVIYQTDREKMWDSEPNSLSDMSTIHFPGRPTCAPATRIAADVNPVSVQLSPSLDGSELWVKGDPFPTDVREVE